MRWAWLFLIGGAALADSGTTKVRVCDKADATKCASVDATGKLSIGGTISASSSVHSTAAAPTYVEGTDNAVSSDLGGATRVVCMGGTCGGASPFADAATFTGGTTSVSVTAGVFNDSLTALASGKAGAPRMTSFRALHLNLRDNSGNEIPFPAALDADGGFKVHVQNAVAVTGTFWQATQPVSGTFWQATQPVSGTFWQATQPVSGPLTDTQLRASAVPVSGTVAATQSGTWTVQPGNTANTTAWKVDGSAVTQPVSGTFWQATQPVSGTFFQVTQPTDDIDRAGRLLGKITGSDGSVLATANGGRAQVDIVTGGGSNASVATNYSTAPTSSTAVGGMAANGTTVPVKVAPDGTLYVVIAQTLTKTPLLAPTRPVAVLGPRQIPTGNENAQVVIASPVPVPICPKQVALSQTASTTVITGSAGKLTYVCKVFVVSTTAQSLSLTEGTGSTCGTLPAALAGSTTVANGMALAANGGWVEGNGGAPVYTAQKLGDDICLLQSGAGNVAGSISYVQF